MFARERRKLDLLFVAVWVEPLADGLCSIMVDSFRSIADEIALRCAMTRNL